MIIWINGTYGVGKSSVAKETKRQIDGKESVILESDELFQSLGEELIYDLILNGGGLNPQNNIKFLGKMKEKLKIYMDSNTICIVPMALTTEESIEILWKYVHQNSNRWVHFILKADETVIIERIKSDCGRIQKYMALSELKTNVAFLKKNFEEAIRINTTGKNVKEVAEEIIRRINGLL